MSFSSFFTDCWKKVPSCPSWWPLSCCKTPEQAPLLNPTGRRGTVSETRNGGHNGSFQIETADPNNGAAILHEAKQRVANIKRMGDSFGGKVPDKTLVNFWEGVPEPFGQRTYDKAVALANKGDADATAARDLLEPWAQEVQA